ncbi:MAG: YfhO family protein [Bellilinea sp.]
MLRFAPWNSVQSSGSQINPVLSDSIDFAVPNRSFFNSSISKGDFPLWNPNISTGTPFGFLLFTDTFTLANLATLLAGVMWGRIVYYVLKLFILGYFTYLFLRQRGIAIAPSYLGAITTSFSSYIIAYLAMHVPDSVIFLPALLYFGEIFYARRTPKYFIASALSVTLMLVSGFPSITFYSILLAIFYFTFRALLDQDSTVSISVRIKNLFAFAGIFLAGLLLAAFSLVPTAEFFNQIDPSYREGRGSWSLDPKFLWRLVVGNFCGNPIDRTWYCSINFNETAIYSGILPIIFTPFSWLKNGQRKIAIFFGISAAVILLISFGIGPWGSILNRLPIFDSNANYRMIALLPVCLGVTTAIGFNNLSLLSFKPKQVMILLVYFTGIAFIFWILPQMNPWNYEKELNIITWQFQLTAGLVLTAGLFGIACIGTKKELYKKVLRIMVVMIAFFDLGYQHHDYNGASDPSTFYPLTPGISYIIEHQSEFERMLPISNRVMVPSFPLYYSINSLFGHWWTSPEYRGSAKLIDPGLFKASAITQPIISYDTINLKSQLIDFYRVKHIVIAENLTSLWEISAGNQKEYNESIKLSDWKTFSQKVVASRDGSLDYILLRINRPHQNPIKIYFKLKIGNQTVVNGENQLVPTSTKGWFKVQFPEQQISTGQEIEFEVTLTDPDVDGNLFIANFDIYPKGSFTVDQEPMTADSAFFLVDEDEEVKNKFKLVYSNEIEIYENVSLPSSLPIVFNSKLVDKQTCASELATTNLFAEVLITQPIDFQNSTGVQLDGNEALIVDYSNNRVQIEAAMKQKGIIVLSDTWFPGWIARVDGVAQEIIQVNCNMRGLIIEPGEHTIVMSYKPASVKVGIAISLLSLILLISWSLINSKNPLKSFRNRPHNQEGFLKPTKEAFEEITGSID